LVKSPVQVTSFGAVIEQEPAKATPAPDIASTAAEMVSAARIARVVGATLMVR